MWQLAHRPDRRNGALVNHRIGNSFHIITVAFRPTARECLFAVAIPAPVGFQPNILAALVTGNPVRGILNSNDPLVAPDHLGHGVHQRGLPGTSATRYDYSQSGL
jgi:hypothetical protein